MKTRTVINKTVSLSREELLDILAEHLLCKPEEITFVIRTVGTFTVEGAYYETEEVVKE